MHRSLPAALLALVACAPLVGAQATGQGERVDITAAEFPALVAGERPFYVNITVANRQAVDATVLLSVRLYDGAPGVPCDGGRFNQTLSRFQKNVAILAGQEVRVVGADSHWAQVVNRSLLSGEGPHEACVWARAAQCPEGEPLQACFLDYQSATLRVRARNAPPAVAPTATPARGTTATLFALDARGADADGDAPTFTWTFADGRTAQGERVQQRFARAGAHEARVTAWDGFDAVEGAVSVQVEGGAGAAPTPAPPLALLALAAGGAALAVRRAGARASPAPRRSGARAARRAP